MEPEIYYCIYNGLPLDSILTPWNRVLPSAGQEISLIFMETETPWSKVHEKMKSLLVNFPVLETEGLLQCSQ
jgi:hypothetical protein